MQQENCKDSIPVWPGPSPARVWQVSPLHGATECTKETHEPNKRLLPTQLPAWVWPANKDGELVASQTKDHSQCKCQHGCRLQTKLEKWSKTKQKIALNAIASVSVACKQSRSISQKTNKRLLQMQLPA